MMFGVIFALCQSLVLSQTTDADRIGFTVPAVPWSLTLSKTNLVVDVQKIQPDGLSGYFLMSDEKDKISISFYIEPAKNCNDSKSCRDMIWKQGNPTWENPQNVVQSEIGGASCVEFFMPSVGGVPLKQQHMYAEFVKDGFWVDLHISKILYEPAERELFVRIIESVKFDSKNSHSRETTVSRDSTTVLNFSEASKDFLSGHYPESIRLYSKTFEQEKKNPTLSKDLWHVLIDNLGMAYGITGKLDSAEEIFNYGVSKDSTYPMFYYNLACTYAERENLDECLNYLTKAFAFRSNMIANEQFPDPMTDDSFQRFVKNPKFLDAVAKMKQ